MLEGELNSIGLNHVAIIGLSLRYPGADNPMEFWNNLSTSRETIHHFDKEKLKSFLKEDFNPDLIPFYGMINGVDKFDASFFGYSPKEAMSIDPQQRIFLECCYEAFENAGLDYERIKVPVGVYAGSSESNYQHLIKKYPDAIEGLSDWQIRIACGLDFISSRVAYKLGLTGPAVTIQTACSTSLVAICQAVQGLLSGDCDMALAGGASIQYIPRFGLHGEGGILSSDGKCRTFDSKANGTVGSNGVGVILLKRLSDAIRDKDHIYSVIIGHAINNDGHHKIGFTAPSISGQSAAIRTAQFLADVPAESIGLVEAHGTATPLGDPIEVAALKNAFKTNKKNYCYLGSVKSNIGHTDAAAGAAGLVKMALCLKNKAFVESLHYQYPNAEIDFENSPFVVNTEKKPWSLMHGIEVRRGAVSSFGIGGTNAHVILQEPPAQKEENKGIRRKYIIPYSAQTNNALEIQRRRLLHYLKNEDFSVSSVAYTLQLGRKQMPCRDYIVCDHSKSDLIQKLENKKNKIKLESKKVDKILDYIFMFPGQGGQYVDMGRDLYVHEAVYRKASDDCFDCFQKLGLNLKEILYPVKSDFLSTDAKNKIHEMMYAQASIFTTEYAMGQFLLSLLADKPKAFIGHSLGMYAAACLSNIFSLSDACALVHKRSSLFEKISDGKMLAINHSLDFILPFLSEDISVAAINTDQQIVVSGKECHIKQLEEVLLQKNMDYKKLNIAAAAHSHLMNPHLAEFKHFISSMKKSKPTIPIYSDIAGKWVDEEAMSDDYWTSHLNSSVNFHQVLNEVSSFQSCSFIEVGPGKTLTTLLKQHPKYMSQTLIRSLPHALENIASDDHFYHAMGEAWCAGVKIDFSSFNQDEKFFKVPLPTYPFERKKYQVGDYDLATIYQDNGLDEYGVLEQELEKNSAKKINQNSFEIDSNENEVVGMIRKVFAQVLGIRDIVSPVDNFFELGGDSLMAVQVLKHVRTKYSLGIPLKTIFTNPTPQMLASYVEQQRGKAAL